MEPERTEREKSSEWDVEEGINTISSTDSKESWKVYNMNTYL